MKHTPENLTFLAPNEIFVFGSNLAGRHGKGAAKTAVELFGAENGQPTGLQGQSFAIPTKDRYIKTLPKTSIRMYVDLFLQYAASEPQLTFYVTKIGCGLAGYSPEDIAPMFRDHTENVVLPKEFADLIN